MSRTAGFMALLVGATVIATVATAQTSPADTTASADARLTWAKRHVELVCRPLEARQMFDKATRCYNDVARIVSETSKTLPTAAAKPVAAPAAKPTRPAAAPAPAVRPVVRTATRRAPAARTRIGARQITTPAPVVRPVAFFEPTVTAPRRCTGVGCLQYTLLGVGF